MRKILGRYTVSFIALCGMLGIGFIFGNHISKSIRANNDLYAIITATGDIWPIRVSMQRIDLAVGIGCCCLILFLCLMRYQRRRFRDKEEYGTADWGKKKDIKPFVDKTYKNNILLTYSERIRLTGYAKQGKNNRNANVLCIGGAGSGKTRFFVKPNILQAHSSYVITDPKGTLLRECGSFLRKQGYKIRVLNLKDPYSMEHFSMRYNPFAYIESEADILTLVETFMSNTNGEARVPTGDPFWQNAEKLLYMAFIGYLWYEGSAEEQTFSMLIHMVRECKIREDDEDFENAIDEIFMELKEKGSIRYVRKDGKIIAHKIPGDQHFAVKQYEAFRNLAAGKTAKSILISCMARLAAFEIPQIKNLTAVDEMMFPKIGEEKTAIFVILSDTNKAFNFIAAIFFKQMFNSITTVADRKYGGKLPMPVRCILDEFPNIGKIPDFEILISTLRSREISVCVIVQTLSQLQELYKKHSETISGNCDSMLFLGGCEKSSLEDISKMLGKQTIDTRSQGDSTGQSQFRNYSNNYQRTGRELMTLDEIARMDGGKCILMVRGCRPFLSKKYNLLKHRYYKFLSDASLANSFDVGKFIEARRKRFCVDMESIQEEIIIME